MPNTSDIGQIPTQLAICPTQCKIMSDKLSGTEIIITLILIVSQKSITTVNVSTEPQKCNASTG